MKPTCHSAAFAAIHRIRLLAGAMHGLASTHRRIAVPVVALLALLWADHSSRPAKEAPGKAENPAAVPAARETRPKPSPAPAMPSEPIGVDVVHFILPGHDARFEQQARLAQAAAAEQAQMLRFQEFQLQREAELRALNAQLRAREAAGREIRRYEEDISGHLHSILGE
jgi:hypothetical protein